MSSSFFASVMAARKEAAAKADAANSTSSNYTSKSFSSSSVGHATTINNSSIQQHSSTANHFEFEEEEKKIVAGAVAYASVGQDFSSAGMSPGVGSGGQRKDGFLAAAFASRATLERSPPSSPRKGEATKSQSLIFSGAKEEPSSTSKTAQLDEILRQRLQQPIAPLDHSQVAVPVNNSLHYQRVKNKPTGFLSSAFASRGPGLTASPVRDEDKNEDHISSRNTIVQFQDPPTTSIKNKIESFDDSDDDGGDVDPNTLANIAALIDSMNKGKESNNVTSSDSPPSLPLTSQANFVPQLPQTNIDTKQMTNFPDNDGLSDVGSSINYLDSSTLKSIGKVIDKMQQPTPSQANATIGEDNSSFEYSDEECSVAPETEAELRKFIDQLQNKDENAEVQAQNHSTNDLLQLENRDTEDLNNIESKDTEQILIDDSKDEGEVDFNYDNELSGQISDFNMMIEQAGSTDLGISRTQDFDDDDDAIVLPEGTSTEELAQLNFVVKKAMELIQSGEPSADDIEALLEYADKIGVPRDLVEGMFVHEEPEDDNHRVIKKSSSNLSDKMAKIEKKRKKLEKREKKLLKKYWVSPWKKRYVEKGKKKSKGVKIGDLQADPTTITIPRVSGVTAASSISRAFATTGKVLRLPINQHYKSEDRCNAHSGYKDVQFYSFHDALIQPRTHKWDLIEWEDRKTKQRFFEEISLENRNWFGSINDRRGNDRYHEPISHPKSFEIPMRTIPDPGEWTEDWFTTWQSRKDNPNTLVLHQRDELLSTVSTGSDVDEDDLWEAPEVGTICTIRLKLGENVSRIHHSHTSILRKSKWKRKYLPRDVFQF